MKIIHSRLCGLLAMLAASAPLSALAQQAGHDVSTTKLDVSGTGSIEAQPDQATAIMVVEEENASAAAAQMRVNQRVHQAIELIRKTPALDVKAASYNTSRERRPNNNATSWVARQTLRIQGKDLATLLDVTGKLQGMGLVLEGVNWTLSPEHTRDLQRQAEKKALDDMRQRANDVAGNLGLKMVSFAEVSVNEPMVYRPMAMMARMAAASPEATPEEQTISANVHASVILGH
ncbi:SIMPL domain-containing protein [Acetobacter estunensis]|uniref:SIMPL domain-containing protein n=1 Tax=Acetobacter estunensis TaxID=104097 RepID=UPI001C2CF004|nr:SIMPL domain-containing protein [Acetobacter estunensis]MBV1836561.1 SIMPL domain-containing protein [Acetobacter estunensis]